MPSTQSGPRETVEPVVLTQQAPAEALVLIHDDHPGTGTPGGKRRHQPGGDLHR